MLLNPSVTETFGNVTLEAMASGVPVIAARATGSTSLVTDGETGRLVEPGDIAGFADAIAAYVADPALRARARRGRRGAQPRLFVGRDQPRRRRHLPAPRRGAAAPLSAARPPRPAAARNTTARRSGSGSRPA